MNPETGDAPDHEFWWQCGGGGGGGGEPPQPPPDPCDDLGKIFDRLVNSVRGSISSGFKGLAQRIQQMRSISKNDPAWNGHLEQIEQRRQQLQKEVEKWEQNDCGDPPPGVLGVLRAPILSSEDVKGLQRTQLVVEIGTGAGLGYAGYRLIRLLPSLLPPLWPTLIPNVIIP